MDLSKGDHMNKFRLLNIDEIECRIAQVSKEGKGISLLLYKTARTDANLLDETFGEEMWENDFKLIDGVLYGGIGIHRLVSDIDGRVKDNVIWKWDAGTESYTEAEKGRASDAFKRAGFKWGIGRELYTAPFIFIPKDKCEIKDGKCYEKFEVSYIEYDEKENIRALSIINSKSRVEVFKWESKERPTEVYQGEDKISFDKVKAISKKMADDGIPSTHICKLYNVEFVKDLTEAQFTNLLLNWEKMKTEFNNERNNS